jgi:Beta-lactamase
VILGVAIHRVTGKFWFDFVKEHIFDPLGMTSTRLISIDDIIPGRVSGYSMVKGQQKNDPWIAPSWNTTADGSLYTNVFDMAKWDAALNTDKLIKHSSLEQMWTPVKLNDGTTYPYGFAWRIREVNGHRLIQHDGVDPAFTTRFARYVNDGLSIVVFLNLGEDDEAAMPTRITDKVAAIYIPALEPSKGRETPASLSKKLNLPGPESQNLGLGRSVGEAFSPAQREVWDVSQAWLDAFNHHDLASFSRYITDDFIASTDEGDLLTKAGIPPAPFDQSCSGHPENRCA